jgi:hypothetical protein
VNVISENLQKNIKNRKKKHFSLLPRTNQKLFENKKDLKKNKNTNNIKHPFLYYAILPD